MSENRSSYRKNLKMQGTLVSGDTQIPFVTKNVSLNGFQAYCSEVNPDTAALEEGDIVYVRLPELNMEGVVCILWTENDAEGGLDFGFKFVNMRGVEGSEFHYREGDQEEPEQV
jgi:hypothetical protein